MNWPSLLYVLFRNEYDYIISPVFEYILKFFREVFAPEIFICIVKHSDASTLKCSRYLFDVFTLFTGKGQRHFVLILCVHVSILLSNCSEMASFMYASRCPKIHASQADRALFIGLCATSFLCSCFVHPDTLHNLLRQFPEILSGVDGCCCVAANGSVGRGQMKDRLTGLLCQRDQASIMKCAVILSYSFSRPARFRCARRFVRPYRTNAPKHLHHPPGFGTLLTGRKPLAVVFPNPIPNPIPSLIVHLARSATPCPLPCFPC